ncbi:MAG: hypothetical protein PWQ67_659 [Clostridia bacterium]|nr:hypothetical protein [Clostridia bacterium]MDN5322205.1 hypothetical protein [Clostridia bacterium]
MEIRITTDDDLERVKWLWAYCFESYEPFFSWYFREYYQVENTLGAYEKSKLVSCLQLIPYKLYLRGQVLPTSYIVGVASFPEARRGGTIEILLKASLEEMRRRGHAVSLLMPFKAGFYYPYQWEICYHHYKFNINLEDLRPVSLSYGEFTPVMGMENIADLNQVYNQFVNNKHGYIVRDERNWRLALEEHQGEKGFTYILKHQGVPKGYVMYYLKENQLLVREMAYSNFEAQQSLFQFLYNHRSQVAKLEWNAPLDDMSYFFLTDPKQGITLYPFLTARIVDVQQALTQIFYPQEIEGEVILKIEDNLAPWNNQIFRVHVRDQQAEVYPVDQEPSIIIGIGAFTQLLFGRLSIHDLLNIKRLTINHPEDVEFLGSLFPVCNNYINEYY